MHTVFDWLLELVALASLIATIAWVGMSWEIKPNFWLLPALSALHYLLLTVLTFLRLSPQHETPAILGLRIRILAWVKASMLASLAYIAWNTVETAQGRADGLESGFIPAAVAIVIVPPLLLWRKMRTSR